MRWPSSIVAPIFMGIIGSGAIAFALPSGPAGFCTTYSNSPHCATEVIECTMCHTTPPAQNPFGFDIGSNLAAGDYDANLPAALSAIELLDSDGDGISNLDEIDAGTFPGLADIGECPTEITYNPEYVFRRVSLDVCGVSPTFEEMETFRGLSDTEQNGSLHARLDQCLATQFWRGKNGAIWEVAHPKVRPVEALRAFADFDEDYNIWAYANLDGNDVRDVLLADYFVERDDVTDQYSIVSDKPGQNTPVDKRVGMVTTRWFLQFFTMFTAVPRNSASQAYRAYLGLDIARQEGLYPIANEPTDYDEKGVADPACATCHTTLDPLSYPFTYYCGFPQATYCATRPNQFTGQWPAMANLPENGFIFGQPVADLLEWAQVGANSDEFAQARVNDFWKRFFGREPIDTERDEFEALATALKETHNYSIDAMLHDLIETEAYGAR